MSDSYTEVTTESWGARLMGSIKSVLFGVVLFLAAFVVIWWNEGRAVKTAKGLDEGAAQVETIPSKPLNVNKDGKLVHLTGVVTTEERLLDQEFAIDVNALKLRRIVEMYQWKENKETTEKKKVGGSVEKTTTYTYEKTWSRSLINSDGFKIPEDHVNPAAMLYNSYDKSVGIANIGEYQLPESFIGRISNYKKYPVADLDMENAEVIDAGSSVYLGEGSVASPSIGDLKIRFEIVEPGEYSMVAQMNGTSFQDFKTSTGTTVGMISAGSHTAASMFEEAQQQNTILTWILRVAGFLMMTFGLASIFRPLVVFADVLPFLGSMLGMGISLFSGIISFALSIVTIGLAWVFYRPVLGIALLLVAIAAFTFFYLRASKKKQEKDKIKDQRTVAA